MSYQQQIVGAIFIVFFIGALITTSFLTFFRVLGFFDFVISRSRIFFAWAAGSSIAVDCDRVCMYHNKAYPWYTFSMYAY